VDAAREGEEQMLAEHLAEQGRVAS
jgi:hypothetical protein